MKKYTYAVLAVGELLGDFIGADMTENVGQTPVFRRFQGGSPANLAGNMARLGSKTAIVSCVGKETLGDYLVAEVKKTGVDTQFVRQSIDFPSSLVLVSRTKGTPDFIPYRTSDNQLIPEDIPDRLLEESAVFHTTCWPLSLQPAQSTVLDAAARAIAQGCLVSIDVNYAARVWPNREEALAVIQEYVGKGALVKLSEDDAARLWNREMAPSEIMDTLMSWGAKLVCLTLGAEGSWVVAAGEEPIFVPARALEVVDATGAGDAYWSGFLTAYLDGHSPAVCAEAGARMAAIKLTTFGPITQDVPKSQLIEGI